MMYDVSYHGPTDLSKHSFLVTGGAGFIGSNLVEYLLKYEAGKVRVLDNFSTGFSNNIEPFFKHKNFELIRGDIRDRQTCQKAVEGITYVLHQAALGSVPRSINDPFTSNEVNISGFLNMVIAAREANVKRIIYAASSSTYGDSTAMPKMEELIGRPLSPYAVTKLVNELYADVFAKLYGMELIGLRYFNVFGQRQAPNGAYAAVIPKFIKAFIQHQSPVINGDGRASRDFTYIDNVVQMNIRSVFTENQAAINQVFNVACGKRITIGQLVHHLKEYLIDLDQDVEKVQVRFGAVRAGDIPHSLASIKKAETLLDYEPRFSVKEGLKEAIQWYAKQANLYQDVQV
jgi:UDP-N-acetylglucosamine/UDP-N-acetylgalactosamine 4-epimerase